MTARVAVLGAYGAVGRVACKELVARNPGVELIIGGRDGAQAGRFARSLGGRADASRVDLFDAESLAAFVRRGDVVLNCAGPSDAIRDTVACAALAERRPLVDVGGDERTVGERAGRWDEAVARGGLVIIDAGWIPGVSGAVARLVDERAAVTLDRVDRLAVYVGDRGGWSPTGMADVLAVARGHRGAGSFQAGAWQSSSVRSGVRRVSLPIPYGRRIAMLVHLGEVRALAERRPERRVEAHVVPMLGPRASVALGLGLGPLRCAPAVAAVLLSRAAVADQRSRGGGGVVAAVAHGQRQGQSARVVGLATTDRSLEVTAACGALVVDRVLRGGVLARGCHYMCDVVGAGLVLDGLRPAGLRYELSD